MNVDYSNNKLRKQLSSATEIKKAFGVNAKKVSIRLSEIEAADNLYILKQIPAANCHQLSGNKTGHWALNISVNHRLIFKILNNPIPLNDDGSVNELLVTDLMIIGSEDYH